MTDPITVLVVDNESGLADLVASMLERERDCLVAEALKAAHYSGFFEWPRESTGEDLAASFGVSPPTYHYHLRAAERKLVSMAFDPELNS